MRTASWQISCLTYCLLVAVSTGLPGGHHLHLSVRANGSHKSLEVLQKQQTEGQKLSIGSRQVVLESHIEKACQGTHGTWCRTYHELDTVPWTVSNV